MPFLKIIRIIDVDFAGKPFVELLKENDVIPGIKVDKGYRFLKDNLFFQINFNLSTSKLFQRGVQHTSTEALHMKGHLAKLGLSDGSSLYAKLGIQDQYLTIKGPAEPIEEKSLATWGTEVLHDLVLDEKLLAEALKKNTVIDERGSLAISSPFLRRLSSLLKSIEKLPTRVALTGEIIPLSDEKVPVDVDISDGVTLIWRFS